MNVYMQSFILGFQKTMRYKANFFISMIKFAFPLCIQYFMWSSVYSFQGKNNVEIFGYTYYKMLAYAIFACITSQLIVSSFIWEVNEDIKQGRLSKYLVKPIDYITYQGSCFMGEKIVAFILSIILTVSVSILINIFSSDNILIQHIFLYYLILLFSAILNFLLYFTICSACFYMKDSTGAIFIVTVIGNIVSGAIFPLDIFSENIKNILKILPFSYVNYFPVSVICGRLGNAEIISGISMQIFWIVITFLSCRIVWRIGLKKYVAIGG